MPISQVGAAPKANCLLAKPNMFRDIPIPFMFIARKLRKWDVEGSSRINQGMNSGYFLSMFVAISESVFE